MNDKILLILDLDETLIHATRKCLRPDFDFMLPPYFVYKRPYLDDFIQICHQYFRLAVWSSASDRYVEEVVESIFPENIELEFVWGRSRCTPIINPNADTYGFYRTDISSHYEYAKIIQKVKRRGFDLERTLIVDDTPLKVQNSYGNAIYPQPYFGEKGDSELPLLAEYLKTLSQVENVRRIEKRFWRNQIMNK